MNRKELIAKIKELEKRIENLETAPKKPVGREPPVFGYTQTNFNFEPLDRAYDPVPDSADIQMMRERAVRTPASDSGG